MHQVLGTRRGLLALAGVLYAPPVFLGYGSDFDAYAVLRAGRRLVGSRFQSYDHSRNPGYFLHELATGLLDALGGSVLTNLGTLAMALVAVGCFRTVLDRLRVRHAGWLTGILIVHPFVWLNAATTMDYVWALGLLMAGWLMAVDRRWTWAGLLLGLAVGARLSSVLVAAPLLAHAFLTAPEARGAVLRAALLALVVGVLLYLPPLAVVGSPLGLLNPAMGTEENWTWALRLGRFGYKNLTFWGLAASAVLAISVTAWKKPAADRTSLLWLCAGVVVAVEALYLRYPLERAYLLPMLPFVLLALGLLLRRRAWVVALALLTALHAFVAVDVAKPDTPFSATGARFGLWIGPGPLVEDVRLRLRLRGCEDAACWYDVTGLPR